MEKITAFTENLMGKIAKIISFKDLLIMVTGILSSRAVIFYEISPFGVACMIAFLLNDYYVLSILFPLLGYVAGNFTYKSLIYIIVAAIMSITVKRLSGLNKKIQTLILTGVYFVINFLFIVIKGITVYDFAFLWIESSLIYLASFWYMDFIRFFSGKTLKVRISTAQVYSLVFVMIISLIPLSEVYLPFNMRLSGVIAAFLLLFSSIEFSPPVCAMIGTFCGLFVGICNQNMLYSMGSYSISSIMSASFSKKKKVNSLILFIMSNALLTYYVNGSNEVLINIYEILPGALVLFLIPYEKLSLAKENLTYLLYDEKEKEISRYLILREETNKKLVKMSKAFSELAKTLVKFEKQKDKNTKDEENRLVLSIRERVCNSCKSYKFCWKENYEVTNYVILKLIKAVEKRGWAENYDISVKFRNSCFGADSLVLEANKVYELFRVNKIWENRISESRLLIARQLNDVSSAVMGLSDEFNGEYPFNSSLEETATQMLNALGIRAFNISVLTGKNRRYRVKVNIKECRKNNVCERSVAPVLSKVLRKEMKCVNNGCFGGNCTVELIERELFKAETHISRVRPEKENSCGDSYAVIKPDGERIIVALSDGMGTGEKAANESRETVNLLDKMLVAGIEKDTAIKLINSVLILKSYEESFATLDMLIFDLYTGVGEFVKTGGVCSYVKRGDKIIKIRSDSLPTGIIGDVEVGSSKVALTNGDVVVLVSDGVLDIDKDDYWLTSMLKESDDCGPKEVSEQIIKNALSRCRVPKDDMTCVAVKIEFNQK